MGTDRDWKRWGDSDPYFGVLSDEAYRGERLDADARKAFFATGVAHVQSVLSTLRTQFDPEFLPGRSLDFGCGVGRVLLPLARASVVEAVGVDISPAMIDECARNAAEQGVDNVRLVQSDESLSAVDGQFDLVHSHIVLVHIPPDRGMRYLSALAGKVAPGGFIAVQILCACNASWPIRAIVRASYRFPPLNWLRNLLRGRPMRQPAMQLHVYPLARVMSQLADQGFGPALLPLDRFPDGSFESVVVIARKQTA